MALPPAEIRYSRYALYFVFGVSGFIFVPWTYIVFFSGVAPGGLPVYISYFGSVLVLSIICILFYKRITDPRPVLVFMSDGLLMPRKNDRFIPWGSITKWKIRSNKNSHSLVIHTAEGKTTIDISWLQLRATAIKDMVERYIRQPGPNGFLR